MDFIERVKISKGKPKIEDVKREKNRAKGQAQSA